MNTNSPQSKTYWLLYQLKRLHRRYRFRKMMLMMIPFTLIVVAYLGIQFKDLYQLKYLKISNQVAVVEEEVEATSEIEAPFVDLSSQAPTSSENEDIIDNPFEIEESEESVVVFEEETTTPVKDEFFAEELEEETKETEFVAGLAETPEVFENGSINKIELTKIPTDLDLQDGIQLPKASPSLLAFKPVPYVRLVSEELFSEVSVEEMDLMNDFGDEER